MKPSSFLLWEETDVYGAVDLVQEVAKNATCQQGGEVPSRLDDKGIGVGAMNSSSFLTAAIAV